MELNQENFTTFSSICGCMNVVPEQLCESAQVLDVLRKGEVKRRLFLHHLFSFFMEQIEDLTHIFLSGVSVSVDICQYETPEESSKRTGSLKESRFAGNIQSNVTNHLSKSKSQYHKTKIHVLNSIQFWND